MMRVLYIHQHFALPSGSTGTRSYEFARRWVKAGHKVIVITGHYDIGGLEYSREPLFIDGIEVRIVGSKYSNKQSFIRRILSFISFMFLSIYEGIRAEKPDIIYATSTPLTVGLTAIAIKWFRRVPFVFEVRDQWPTVPIALGVIKNPLIKQLTLWLEKFIYNQSSGIVALSPGMRDGVKQVVGSEKEVLVAPNCCDLDRFSLEVEGKDVRDSYGWNDKFVILHFGSMGKANGLEFLVEVADRLKSFPDIHFVIVGDGATKQELEDKAKKLNLTNIEFIGNIKKEKLPEFVAACDISTVVFARYKILEDNSANKFFDSLAAGKPILLNYSGWQRQLLEQQQAGFGCKQCDIDEYVEKLLELNRNSDTLVIMGKNARRLAKKYSREDMSNKVLEFIINKG